VLRRIIYITTALIVLSGISIFYSQQHSHNKSKSSTSAKHDPGPVHLANSASLSNILLKEQYNAVYYTLSSFIQSKISPDVSKAAISDDGVSIASDGTVLFSINVDSPKKLSFKVEVDRSVFDRVTVNVPAYKYSQTTKIY
jgi:hypothetical protein